MKSNMFSLNISDWEKACLMAILVGFALPLAAAVQTPGFSIFTVNWMSVLGLAINGAVIGGATYLIKNFLSNDQGKFLGKVG